LLGRLHKRFDVGFWINQEFGMSDLLSIDSQIHIARTVVTVRFVAEPKGCGRTTPKPAVLTRNRDIKGCGVLFLILNPPVRSLPGASGIVRAI
jgi:hypothetical protein